jgi:hypothetical protein
LATVRTDSSAAINANNFFMIYSLLFYSLILFS